MPSGGELFAPPSGGPHTPVASARESPLHSGSHAPAALFGVMGCMARIGHGVENPALIIKESRLKAD